MYAIAVISMTCFMALDLSSILISGDSSLIQAKQVRDYSASQGKSIVIDSLIHAFGLKKLMK